MSRSLRFKSSTDNSGAPESGTDSDGERHKREESSATPTALEKTHGQWEDPKPPTQLFFDSLHAHGALNNKASHASAQRHEEASTRQRLDAASDGGEVNKQTLGELCYAWSLPSSSRKHPDTSNVPEPPIQIKHGNSGAPESGTDSDGVRHKREESSATPTALEKTRGQWEDPKPPTQARKALGDTPHADPQQRVNH
eukprot:CAMPEP_0183603446 /NCGR_PEP_ID=MMETSP0371-20130417/181450_1 /TAXON_ID=268820 /ORGANISM="Peridinium aciculiferum, Strain PAER-2" /LENGTH=196 /DNA_ID=CAMNT_0025815543 /DNA_START=215 /DNA_END=806 /DNA_ORIENTATION=-